MAHRRMFSKAIVGSARFLKMPMDSQSLYFHLGMATDDDGVVEAWSVLRETGSAEDNLRVLASKGFIKVLNEDLVTYIMDWNEHNELRADRLVPSQYRELLVQMLPEVQLVEPRRRADLKPKVPALSGRPLDDLRTEEDRLGKVSITSELEDEIRVVEVSSFEGEEKAARKPAKYPHSKEVFSLFPVPEPSWLLNTTELKHTNLLYARGLPKVKDIIRFCYTHKDYEDLPMWDSPTLLERNWPRIIKFADRNGL